MGAADMVLHVFLFMTGAHASSPHHLQTKNDESAMDAGTVPTDSSLCLAEEIFHKLINHTETGLAQREHIPGAGASGPTCPAVGETVRQIS